MKKRLILIVALAFWAISGISQTLSKTTLCKKWHLEKYEIYWIDYAPDDNEKNDYIWLKTDMSYESIDEGEYSEGKWAYSDSDNYFILYDESDEGLKFFVQELTSGRMIVRAGIEEMDDVDIHFVTQ